jgi:hypothetical protein
MTLYSELDAAIERDDGAPVVAWAREVLDGVLTDRLGVGVVRHPLGFLCVPAHRDGPEGVCVHLWEARSAPAAPITSVPHSHSWDLSSWVAAGALHNRTIRVVDTDDAPTHRVFDVRSGPEGDHVRPTSRLVRTEVERTLVHRAGERYRLSAGIFHETVVPDEADVVVTVALGWTRAAMPNLSLGDPDAGEHRVVRQLCERDEAVRVASIGLAAIAG